MVDRTSPDAGRTGFAVGRLLVAAGLVLAGLFAGTGVSAAADAAPVVSPYSYTLSDYTLSDYTLSDYNPSDYTLSDAPAFEEPTGSRIG